MVGDLQLGYAASSSAAATCPAGMSDFQQHGQMPTGLTSYDHLAFTFIENNDVENLMRLNDAETFDIEAITESGETGLIYASRLGNEAVVRWLCENGADVNSTDDDEWSALTNACKEGFKRIVEILLDYGANIEISEMGGWTPLVWATYKNRLDIVQLLLQRGANCNVIDEHGVCILIWAAGRGYTDVVFELVRAGANVNVTDKFSNTALIWACRRGYTEIVRVLLTAGADVDVAGSNSWSPLLLATKINARDIVESLVQRSVNINATDKDGCTALSVAAREGYSGIVDSLLAAGAYVNLVDKKGDTVLCSAVRSGHLDIVKALLNKYADVNAKDSNGRTPLYIAVDKGFADVVAALLECHPDAEIKSKDGDTPLLRAVRNRNALIVQLLVKHGAKVGATDKNKENALHIALRSRSRRLTQILLSKPKDNRLLYRPNVDGETPYSIDQSHAHPILPHIFGPIESHADTEAMLGYDLYSTVLADIASEPTLQVPLTCGLYAKWGSGKSFLMQKLKDSMTLFSRSYMDMVEFKFTFLLAVIFFVVILTPVLHVASNWLITIIVSVSAITFICLGFVLVWYTARYRHWNWSFRIGQQLAENLAKLKLVWSLLFFHAPSLREKDLLACPVMFLFADYHRLSSIGGEQSLANIVLTLHQAVERHYGRLASRIHAAFKPRYASGNSVSFRRMCGIPTLFMALVLFLATLFSLHMLIFYTTGQQQRLSEQQQYQQRLQAENIDFLSSNSSSPYFLNVANNDISAKDGAVITTSTFLFVSIVLSLYPLLRILCHSVISLSEMRIKKAVAKVDQLKFEGFMELLQREVDSLVDTVRCMDSFTGSQTRLVVFVDGLDSCESDRMLMVLDAISLLFQKTSTPFLVVLAIDPYLVISAVHRSLHSIFKESEITGHDYLRNMVQMPFYLQNTAIQKLHERMRKRSGSFDVTRQRFARQDTMYGSYMSLAESTRFGGSFIGGGGAKNFKASQATLFGIPMDPKNLDFSARIIRDDYFSSINPRSMKRIINTLNLTGRLLRSFEIEFNWLTLGFWISLIEQWPYRMAWIIDCCESGSFTDSTTVKEAYDVIKHNIPTFRTDDPMIDIDRNPKNFEKYLASAHGEPLTVHHVKTYVPVTTSLDPYLRKILRERREMEKLKGNAHRQQQRGAFMKSGNYPHLHVPGFSAASTATFVNSPSPAAFVTDSSARSGQALPVSNSIFNSAAWNVRLSTLNPDDLCELLKHLNYTEPQYTRYCEQIRKCNISGLVLSICDLDHLKQEMQMTFGDWEVFKLAVTTLRDKEISIYLNQTDSGDEATTMQDNANNFEYYYRNGPNADELETDGARKASRQRTISGASEGGVATLVATSSASPNTLGPPVMVATGSLSRKNSANRQKYMKHGSAAGVVRSRKSSGADQARHRGSTLRSTANAVESATISEEQPTEDGCETGQDWLQLRLGHLDSIEFAGDRHLSGGDEEGPEYAHGGSPGDRRSRAATTAGAFAGAAGEPQQRGHPPLAGRYSGNSDYEVSGASDERVPGDEGSICDSNASICGSREHLADVEEEGAATTGPQRKISGAGSRRIVGGFSEWTPQSQDVDYYFCGPTGPLSSSRRSSILRSQMLQVTMDDNVAEMGRPRRKTSDMLQAAQDQVEFEAKLASLASDLQASKAASATARPWSPSRLFGLGGGSASRRRSPAASSAGAAGDQDSSGGRSPRQLSGGAGMERMKKHSSATPPHSDRSSAKSGSNKNVAKFNPRRHSSSSNASARIVTALEDSSSSSDDDEVASTEVQLTVKQKPNSQRPTLFSLSSGSGKKSEDIPLQKQRSATHHLGTGGGKVSPTLIPLMPMTTSASPGESNAKKESNAHCVIDIEKGSSQSENV